MKPARTNRRWLTASASAGASLSVGIWACDQRMKAPEGSGGPNWPSPELLKGTVCGTEVDTRSIRSARETPHRPLAPDRGWDDHLPGSSRPQDLGLPDPGGF